MKNVLMIGPSRDVHGGISAVVNNLYEAGLDKKVNLKYLPTMSEGSKFHKFLVAAGAYFKYPSLLKWADVLHVNVASDSSFLRKAVFIKKAFRKGVRIVIHQHGGDIFNYYADSSDSRKAYIKEIFNMGEKVIVLSPEYAEFFGKLTDPGKVLVMPNRIRIGEKPKSEENHSNQKVLFLGRICKAKGIEELLEAFDRIHEGFPDAKLCIGGIYEDEEYRQKIEKRKDYVEYLGWISGEDKDKALRNSYIFVLPSYFEGQGLSILEAFAWKVPAVASNVGGIPMMVENMKTGILVEPKNSDSLYEGLKTIISDEKLRNKLGHAAYEKAVSEFDINKSVEELIRLYNG